MFLQMTSEKDLHFHPHPPTPPHPCCVFTFIAMLIAKDVLTYDHFESP